MTTWQEYYKEEGRAPAWPYPIKYEQEQEIETDVLIIGGGIAGCWAAISAARQGLKVALVEKGRRCEKRSREARAAITGAMRLPIPYPM